MATTIPVGGRVTKLTGRHAERAELDLLVDAVRAGRSRALVVRGEPGVGKTALLDYLATQASGFAVVRATGVQSEMELAFAGLHQLLAPMLDRLERLPAPQREALRTAFGLSPGPAPDRFFIGLAVLGLVAELSEARPLLCIVDDEQWLDRASVQVLAFVARRLEAESVGLVFAARGLSDEVAGLPELVVDGLPRDDANHLLDTVLTAPLDAQVRDQIIDEARGNPLALLELLRDVTPAELAGGFGLAGGLSLAGTIEESFRRRLDALPYDTRRLLVLAAADPVGEPLLVWRAAASLGISADAASPAADADLLDVGTWVRFRHPLVRSAAYRSATPQERREVHRALAEVTDPQTDPDRRAWHRAEAAPAADEDIATELERSADRAEARGGLAAAAAFLERAADLTEDPGRHAERQLAAARAQRDAGALDAALGLLVAVEAGPSDPMRTAEVEVLQGQIALMQRRGHDAARLLRRAAHRLEPLDAARSRETYLEAIGAAIWVDDIERPGALTQAALAARAAPPGPQPPRDVDLLLDAYATRLTHGYAAAAPMMTRALERVLHHSIADEEAAGWLWLTDTRAAVLIALELWDAASWHALAVRLAQLARDRGALVHLQFALNYLAWIDVLAGEFTTASDLLDEAHVIAEATGTPPISNIAVSLSAWRGEERAPELTSSTMREAIAHGQGSAVTFANYAIAVLENGRGRHAEARDAAWHAFTRDEIGYGPLVVPELAEAAHKTGDRPLVEAALEWLAERARVTPTSWALGIEARIRAFLSEENVADACYRDSLAHLGRTRFRPELARTHLLFGEWLRGQNRRHDARTHLRTAHEIFLSIGAAAFADRTARELLAAGDTVRARPAEQRSALTAQEAQIARLARDGLSNPEIGARMFISPRTVQYHLRKVFTKLDISSRNELDRALPGDTPTIYPS